MRSGCRRATARPRTTSRCASQRAVFSYVRGQVAFSLIMGFSAASCLWFLGVARASSPTASATRCLFGVFYGLMELIPYIGPILGGAAAGRSSRCSRTR